MTNSNADPRSLDDAIDVLRDAKPEPEVVLELAKSTIEKRENPHSFQSLFQHHFDNAICRLCGFYVAMNAPMLTFEGKHPAHRHVEWHNAMYRAGVEIG